ncbi:MAG: hypothetical protein EHM45_22090 [Desulfobacteraceae bacterium]|nr:MAG: hypothetical protein EHM45_22090 [Desulfobacteraceae bacterium]
MHQKSRTENRVPWGIVFISVVSSSIYYYLYFIEAKIYWNILIPYFAELQGLKELQNEIQEIEKYIGFIMFFFVIVAIASAMWSFRYKPRWLSIVLFLTAVSTLFVGILMR